MTETTLRPVPQPGILRIAPYVPGKSQAVPGVVPVKLSANESPLGASPRAIAAYQAQGQPGRPPVPAAPRAPAPIPGEYPVGALATIRALEALRHTPSLS